MAFRINYLALNQQNGLPTEGNPVATFTESSPATAPVGCQYITISHTATCKVKVDGLTGVASQYQDIEYGVLGAGTLNIPNVGAGAIITITES